MFDDGAGTQDLLCLPLGQTLGAPATGTDPGDLLSAALQPTLELCGAAIRDPIVSEHGLECER